MTINIQIVWDQRGITLTVISGHNERVISFTCSHRLQIV